MTIAIVILTLLGVVVCVYAVETTNRFVSSIKAMGRMFIVVLLTLVILGLCIYSIFF